MELPASDFCIRRFSGSSCNCLVPYSAPSSSQLVQADRSALKIQVLYRARLIKFLYKNIKAAGVLEKAKKAYAKEMAELHDGTKVRAVVQRDRKKEKREYQIFLMEEEKARRLEALYWVVEWPWVETWDEANESLEP